VTVFHIFLVSFKKLSKKQAASRATRLRVFMGVGGVSSLHRTFFPLPMAQFERNYFQDLGLTCTVLLQTAALHHMYE
jgi:hypothetical protein